MALLDFGRRKADPVALADPNPATPPEGEKAGHGSGNVTASYFGNVEAEIATYNRERLSYTTMRKMMRHPVIRACAALTELGLRFAPTDVNGPDPLVNEFVRAALEPIWGSIIHSCVYTGVMEGCAPHERVWRRTTARCVVKDDTGAEVEQDVDGWMLAKVKDIDPASLSSILVNGLEDFAGYKLTVPAITLPPERAWHFVSGGRFGNLWGESRLISAYDAWYAHRILQALWLRFMERRVVPPVHVEFPAGSDDDGNPNSDTAGAIARGFQSSDTAIWTPAGVEGQPKWAVSLIEDAQRAQVASSFTDGLARLEKQMMLSLLTPEKILSGEAGAYALSKTHKDVWLLGLEGTLSDIIAAVNTGLVPDIVRYTFGADAPVPKVEAAGLSDESKDFLGGLLVELVKTGQVSVDADAISERLNVPVLAGESATDSQMSMRREVAALASDLQRERLLSAVRR